MSVYTTVSRESLQHWLQGYALGQLLELKGIAAGITNTNYFVTTTHGRYVLTLFETLHLDELPYYLTLMSHLAKHGVACPVPVADHTDRFASTLAGKPACLVSCLAGQDVSHPSAEQCRAVGEMLAQMHKAGATFPLQMKNPRGPRWWSRTAQQLYPQLPADQAELLREEIQFQDSHRFDHLPSGVIHADLFRDNVLLDGNHISGFIDFYYACNDILLYDVAIAVNDWARLDDDELDGGLARAFLEGYQSERPLEAAERDCWPVMLRAAALRFWVSRLQDLYQPASGELTYTKDPAVFQNLLLGHHLRQDFWLD
ncbi:serine kinase [Chromobacterium violaceum]|uniref:homoserine kinase n=1 Tax=Chromobacterium violaceum TaxID=536 RepID=UPI000652CBD6|nr:homoserine kinase [Chromobacterium violaceum]KMN50675.1 serine kinase [Chromobacterium violaceum]KMN87171.1 serine kinase [Chromobacterium violaceum]KMN89704.1 serine kinase [Chromobacterium violaceum]KMO03747.1 serine kinase [Chromobacterium violaceum]